MSDELWVALIGAGGALLSGFVGVFGALLGTKVGAQANMRATLAAAEKLAEVEKSRYIRERTWDEKRRVYSLCLESITKAAMSWNLVLTHVSNLEDDTAYEASADFRRLFSSADEAWVKFGQDINAGRLTVSMAFSECARQLSDDVDEIYRRHRGHPHALSEELSFLFERRFDLLFKIAASELLPEDEFARHVGPQHEADVS